MKVGFDVEIVVMETILQIFLEQVVDLVWIKTGQGNIKGLCLQRLDLDAQQFFVPSGIHGHPVVRDDVRFLLCFGQVVGKDAGHLSDAFLFCCEDTPVARDDTVVTIDDDRVYKTELPQRGSELVDLLRGVGAGVIDIRNESVDRDKFHFSGGSHRTRPHSANFSNPPIV